MDVEEEVILWVTSDLCASPSNGMMEVTMDSGTMSASAIETLTIQSIDVMQYEEEKHETEQTQPDKEIRDIPSVESKKSRKRGFVWNYFMQTTQDRAQCTICTANISFKGKSTNNLYRHLRTKHKVFEEKRNGGAASSDSLSLIETPTVDVSPTTEAYASTCFFVSKASVPDLTPDLTSTSDIKTSQPALFSPVISSDKDVEEVMEHKRRGVVWKYFKTNPGKRAAKCRECSTLISFKGGSTTNLLRHIKSKHPGLKVPQKFNRDETSAVLQYAYAEIVSECVKSDVEDETNTDDCNEGRLTAQNDGITTTTFQLLKSDVEEREIVIEARERKKSAPFWKYFTMENEDHGRCNMCNALISFKGGSTSNLIRHLKAKHPELDLTLPLKEDIEIIDSPESEATAEKVTSDAFKNVELEKFVKLSNPRYEYNLRSRASLPSLSETKKLSTRFRKRGVARSYFDAVSEKHYRCQICNAVINLRSWSKKSLLRHLMSKHPHLDSLLRATNDEATKNDNTSSFDRNASINLENIENIPVDGLTSTEDRITRKLRKRGSVRNYFTPLDDGKAKCFLCTTVLSCISTSNLLRHMKKKHPHFDIRNVDYLKAEELIADGIESNDEDEDNKSVILPKQSKLLTNNETSKRITFRKMLRKRGRVWNYFKPIAPDKAKCGLCNAIVIQLRGSVTNLLYHMKKKHSSIDLTKEKSFNKRLRYCPRRSRSSDMMNEKVVAASLAAAYSAATRNADMGNPTSSSSTDRLNTIYHRSEMLSEKHFDKPSNRSVNLTKNRLFDDQLVQMIVKRYLPFTIVENEKFQKFVEQVNPGYSLPGLTAISSRIPELYEKCARQLRDELQNVRYVMVSMNDWTLYGNEKYVSIAAHYIDDESCTLHSSMLDCFQYDEQLQTPKKLAVQIETILSDWGVVEKLIVIVCDNVANITAAIQLLSLSHIQCFANILNTVVNNGLQLFDELCNKVDFIIERFRKNRRAMKKLKAALVRNGQADVTDEVKSLKVEDPRNWQTTYSMFYWLLVCKTSFTESLPLAVTLTDDEWHLMEHICAVLKPFVEIMREMGENNITISKVIPLSQGVANYLRKTLLDESLPKSLVVMIETMLNDVTVRFSDIEDNSILAEATFLDPRFKNHAFASQQSYANTYHSILQKVASFDRLPIGDVANGQSISKSDVTSNNPSLGDIASIDGSSDDIWVEFDSKVVRLGDTQNSETLSIAEMENYLMETIPKRNTDPLVWWRNKRTIYPHLYEIMKQRLCIAATAVSTNFTNAELFVCEKRDNFSSRMVSMIFFLNQNL